MADAVVLKRLLVVCVLAGLALSVYAAVETMVPSLQGSCYVSAWVQCGAVAQSTYSSIGPIPVWSLGVGGFVILLGLAILHHRSGGTRWLGWMWVFAILGLAASVVLLAVEVFLIHAICPVCVASYAAEFAVFLVVWGLRRAIPSAPEASAA